MTPKEAAALRARLLADPAAATAAEELGLSLAAYVDATVAFCEHPERGFLGKGVGPAADDREERDLRFDSDFEAPARRPMLPS